MRRRLYRIASVLSLHPVLVASGTLILGCSQPAAPEPTISPEPTATAQPEQPPAMTEEKPWMNPALGPDERARRLVAAMTQDEKLTLVFGYFGTDAPWKEYEAPSEALHGSGGFVPGVPRLGIPPQWQTDAGIGVATQGSVEEKRERTALPSGLAVAASWDPEVARRGGEMIGSEARDSGFNVMLAGSVNLLRDAYNGRNFEYGGEDPLLAGIMAGSQIAGIQSNHVISTVKHFAINDQETDRMKGNSILDDASARMSDLFAFQIAIERGAPGSVMCAYNKVNGTYACEHPYLLTEVLRNDWGYPGYVMSDWGATHSTAPAANAGLDQESGWPFDDQPYFGALLKEALAKGEVTTERLDLMVTRILRSMFAHGLFDHPVQTAEIDMAAHARVTQAAAEEGIVLLKNERDLLPLSADLKNIAIIGGYADRAVLSGGGSSQVYPVGGNAVPGLEPQTWPGPVVYYPSSPLAKIKELAPEAKVEFDDGTDPKAAAALAKKSDVAIVFVTQWATESIDTSIALEGGQDALVQAVARANRKTIVVLENGGPVLLPWASKVPAIVEAWYPGTEGGTAIANVLFGRVNPSGHLPTTFPAKASQLAHPDKPQEGDVHYTEGAAVGYKWFDKKGHVPLFAFGHGLSYTTFGYDELKVAASSTGLDVTFTVTNTGKRAGKDVAQVYVAGKGWEAPKRLGGFAKVDLQPGEKKALHVHVDPRLLATWNTDARRWDIAGGPIEVLLGQSSRDIVQRATVEVAHAELPATWRPAPAAPAGQ